jgi:2-hydroxycyclohexanecarboxyl-CoA dehydrogenase
MVQAVLDRWGRLDVLVNNAGRTRIGPFIDAPEEHWRELLEVDLLGVMRCTQVALPYMCRQKWGRVINMASDAARTGLPGQTVYAAAKGAIIAFTKSLAREVAADNVLVNAVSPGPVNTPPLQRLFERQPDFARKLQEEIPLGRVAEVDDVAGMVSFLASEDARYITGQVLSVNGGWVTA